MEKTLPEKITIGSEIGARVTCVICQKEGAIDHYIPLQDGKGQKTYLCPECKEEANKVYEDETKNPKILSAVIGGAIGAMLGGIVWYFVTISTGREIGYVSLGMGYLIGFGVHLGAGRKRGQTLQYIAALVAIIAILVTEKFIFEYFLNEYIRQNPVEFLDFPVGQSLSVSFFEPEFWKNLISPIGLIIYGIGVYIAYMFCKPRKI